MSSFYCMKICLPASSAVGPSCAQLGSSRKKLITLPVTRGVFKDNEDAPPHSLLLSRLKISCAFNNTSLDRVLSRFSSFHTFFGKYILHLYFFKYSIWTTHFMCVPNTVEQDNYLPHFKHKLLQCLLKTHFFWFLWGGGVHHSYFFNIEIYAS